MGLTEVCALARAAGSPYRPDFDLNLLERRISAEAARQSYGGVFIVLTKLSLVIRKWQEEKSKVYVLELEQKAKAVELDFFYLVTALFAAICSASLKISKACAENLYKK